MLKVPFAALLSILAASAFANTGIFRGSGAAPKLGSTDRIQMVEETVIMVPMRGNYPVGSNGKNMDPMKFHCTFRFRNLSDQTVTVPVGFPISTDAVWFHDASQINQTELAARFAFAAGTKEAAFPVRFVPYDSDRKFSSIFLWEMTFRPKQEITLYVHYTMYGYTGLMSATKLGTSRRKAVFRHGYLSSLSGAAGEGHSYVTETGGCWAGKVEKAVFRIYPFEFEEYLRKRGPWEMNPAEQGKTRAELLRRGEAALTLLTPETPMVLNWNPVRSEWKEIVPSTRGSERYLELVCAPLDPVRLKSLSFFYAFPLVPTTPEQFDRLLSEIKKKMDRRWSDRARIAASREKMKKESPAMYEKYGKAVQDPEPYSPAVGKNLADAVLEFYGIRTDNPEIRDFLELQCWYPVKNPPKLSPALKARLEAESGKK